MKKENLVRIRMESRSVNEAFARSVAGAYLMPFDPTLEELGDVKTAVSEAITNCIIHGYDNEVKKIRIDCRTVNRDLHVWVTDEGKGIEDVKKAMEPMYTTRPELERSGMGFAFMEAFMDEVRVESKIGCGTSVYMRKNIGKQNCPYD